MNNEEKYLIGYDRQIFGQLHFLWLVLLAVLSCTAKGIHHSVIVVNHLSEMIQIIVIYSQPITGSVNRIPSVIMSSLNSFSGTYFIGFLKPSQLFYMKVKRESMLHTCFLCPLTQAKEHVFILHAGQRYLKGFFLQTSHSKPEFSSVFCFSVDSIWIKPLFLALKIRGSVSVDMIDY